MTPLAMFLTKQLISRKRDLQHIWVEKQNRDLLWSALSDIHMFEVTEVFPILRELTNTMHRIGIDKSETIYETYSFLPAPKTWIEWRHGSGNRIAMLLEEGNPWHKATFFCNEFATNLGSISAVSGDFYDGSPGSKEPRYLPQYITDLGGEKSGQGLLAFAHTTLVVINSPKIIGRRQHMPHAGIERRLRRKLGSGSFPLHAWTEIKLEVNKPVEIDDGELHEAHLTGRRALHFCRKHIRIRLGKLEYVSAHWRGDASIGIKQSRYKVSA